MSRKCWTRTSKALAAGLLAVLTLLPTLARAETSSEQYRVYTDAPRLFLRPQRLRLLRRERERQSIRWMQLNALVSGGAPMSEPGFAEALFLPPAATRLPPTRPPTGQFAMAGIPARLLWCWTGAVTRFQKTSGRRSPAGWKERFPRKTKVTLAPCGIGCSPRSPLPTTLRLRPSGRFSLPWNAGGENGRLPASAPANSASRRRNCILFSKLSTRFATT